MKPLKKIKGCPGCIFLKEGHLCDKTTTKVPSAVYNGVKKCSMRKKNKHIYF